MLILQVSPQLPSNLQISQSTGIIIALGLAVLVIIIAIALVLRARRRSMPEGRTVQPTRREVSETNEMAGFEPETARYSEATTTIPLAEEPHKEAYTAPSTVPISSDESFAQSDAEHTLEELPTQESGESIDVTTLKMPQRTTKIIKGNVNIAAVTASADQAADIHSELVDLGYSEAITPSEAVIDEASLKAKIAEVRDDLDSNEMLSIILLKCIDIAKSLNQKSDLIWLQREAFGSTEWDDSMYIHIGDQTLFPAYRLMSAKMYLSYTREDDEFPTIEEYTIPVFENRSIYALEKMIEAANIANQDYIVLNTPAPAEWPSTVSLGELIPLTIALRDYLDILYEVKKRVYDFIRSR